MTTEQKLSIASNAAGLAVGLTMNHFLDKELASSPNPGKINKLFRWNLKWGGRIAVVTAIASVGLSFVSQKDIDNLIDKVTGLTDKAEKLVEQAKVYQTS